MCEYHRLLMTSCNNHKQHRDPYQVTTELRIYQFYLFCILFSSNISLQLKTVFEDIRILSRIENKQRDFLFSIVMRVGFFVLIPFFTV